SAWPWPTTRATTSTAARCWNSSTSASSARRPEPQARRARPCAGLCRFRRFSARRAGPRLDAQQQEETAMPYSVYVAALLGLLLIALSFNVSRLRMRHQVAFGDGGRPDLIKAVRAHGDSLEQSLLFIVLLYLGDASGQIDG